VDVTRSHVSLVCVNLKGELCCHERLTMPFAPTSDYTDALKTAVDDFCQRHALPCERILGAGLSLPGILSNDTLAYSHALGVRDFPLETFRRSLRFPILAVNDANAAALAEKNLLDPHAHMIYLSLSNSVGGAIFVDGQLFEGDHGRSGEFGHMPVVPDGRVCYCGKQGCYDGYGSALLLSTPYAGRLEEFFAALSSGDQQASDLWSTYRRYLALMCNHLRMAFDTTVMLGGYVGAFLEPWLEQIRHDASVLNTFDGDGQYICCCRYKTEAAATGAALMHIERYLDALQQGGLFA